MITHTLTSPRQAGPTTIRVLLPDDLATPCRVLYVLPVNPGEAGKWGDGLAEVAALDLHNRHRLICVAPSFSDWPWYADHPADLALAQESYFLHDVLPLMEQTYAVLPTRLLVGFSKSGWGAFSLLLRHPHLFARAAAFDAPLWMDWPGKHGSDRIFGDEGTFLAHHPRELLRRRAAEFVGGPERLMLLGDGNFHEPHQQFASLLAHLNVPHRNLTGEAPQHHWNAGWLGPAVEFLAGR